MTLKCLHTYLFLQKRDLKNVIFYWDNAISTKNIGRHRLQCTERMTIKWHFLKRLMCCMCVWTTDQISVCERLNPTTTHCCNILDAKQLCLAVFSGQRAEITTATLLQQILA